MRTRIAHAGVVIVLLAVGAGAAFTAWHAVSGAEAVQAAARDLDAAIGRLDAALDDLRITQASYVFAGQPDSPALERGSAHLRDLQAAITALRGQTRGRDAATHVAALSTSLSRLTAADTRARDHLRDGNALLASEVIVGELRETADTMVTTVSNLRQSEAAAADAAATMSMQRAWLVIAGAGFIWTVGLLLLAALPARPAAGAAIVAAEPAHLPAAAPPPVISPAVDLPGTARVCSALSRVSCTTALPDLFAKVADLVDASGLIVWMGAGDELFAVTAYGYDPRFVDRLGTIARASDNATATAWRLGELRTVPHGESSNGAIVAPMFGPAGCMGVLAVEVRDGREADPATCALVEVVAAQLATIVSAWPAASEDGDSTAAALADAGDRATR